MEFFICVLGMVMIVEGLPYFIAPEKMQQMLKMISTLPPSNMRRTGLVLMSLGLLLLYLGKTYV
ncbi:DUF2065 domain-containing protein [Desulfococcaceae bacterium OttesenSCG-928-F15]|nr:DUF2065 domain-containing protein [Desulfococcaceae bacterium OttesenSCG-928-F15]